MARRRTVKDVLKAALLKLERYGWVQDQCGSRKIGYCMTGAISASTGNYYLAEDAIAALDAVVTKRDAGLLQESASPRRRVQDFNDKDNRRKQTILAIYRRAIKAVA